MRKDENSKMKLKEVVQVLGKCRIRSGKQEGRKEMFYLTTHSTHFIYGYMASHIW